MVTRWSAPQAALDASVQAGAAVPAVPSEEDAEAAPPAAAARSPATIRVARAAFPKGHPSLGVGDAQGEVFTDRAFAARFPRHGQPALGSWRLAPATILQCAEGHTDPAPGPPSRRTAGRAGRASSGAARA